MLLCWEIIFCTFFNDSILFFNMVPINQNTNIYCQAVFLSLSLLYIENTRFENLFETVQAFNFRKHCVKGYWILNVRVHIHATSLPTFHNCTCLTQGWIYNEA